MQFKDYYATLDVKRDATADEIKKAFRRMARKYHPDVSKEKDAEQKMKDVNEAYAVLSDPEKRAAYDQVGSGYQGGQDFQPPPNWDAGVEFSGQGFNPRDAADYSDFFAELFGRAGGFSGMGGAHAARGNFQLRGEDHHAKIMLSIDDSLRGATRQISLRIPKLDARGHLMMAPRTLNVKIPKGIIEGQTIRLAGQGEPGHGGAPTGDLLLEAHFEQHPLFHLEGRDLHMKLHITPWEAALGAVLPIDLPDGQIKVRIPAGAQSEQPLRVRGKGLPSNPPGDLLLDLHVVLPAADTPKAKEFYETMARELNFNPRSDSQEHSHAQ
jgi:curved DNA-binding protein